MAAKMSKKTQDSKNNQGDTKVKVIPLKADGIVDDHIEKYMASRRLEGITLTKPNACLEIIKKQLNIA